MKLVHFSRFDGKDSISFVADKIIAVVENQDNEKKASVFVLSAGGENDEFVIGNSYREAVTILEVI